MRTMGQWTRRARMMAAEFQRNLDEMMREAEMEELRRNVESISPANLKAKVETMVDAEGIEQALRVSPMAPTPNPAIEPDVTLASEGAVLTLPPEGAVLTL